MPPRSSRNSNKRTKQTRIVGRMLGHLMQLRLAKPPSLEEGQGSSRGFGGRVRILSWSEDPGGLQSMGPKESDRTEMI